MIDGMSPCIAGQTGTGGRLTFLTADAWQPLGMAAFQPSCYSMCICLVTRHMQTQTSVAHQLVLSRSRQMLNATVS